MKRALTAAALGTAAVLAFGTASAEPYEIGVLECAAPDGQSLTRAATDLSCTFKPSITERESETYAGSITADATAGATATTGTRQSMSAGIGTTGKATWRVFATGPDLSQGGLSGDYTMAAPGQGAPADALVGGADNTVFLQPAPGQDTVSTGHVSRLTLKWPS